MDASDIGADLKDVLIPADRLQARRTPISLVRSVTLTNMTFMITIPPTTAEIELTITNTEIGRAHV